VIALEEAALDIGLGETNMEFSLLNSYWAFKGEFYSARKRN
jgi:hypothetical protein